jgi:hypothetical protein
MKREKGMNRRREEFETIFINGKQKRVRRAQTIDGLNVDDFLRRNADPVWLHQNEMWEYLTERQETAENADACERNQTLDEDEMLPF